MLVLLQFVRPQVPYPERVAQSNEEEVPAHLDPAPEWYHLRTCRIHNDVMTLAPLPSP